MLKIVVCTKQVPDTTEIKINPATGTLIRDGVPSIMNPDDKGALELALRLKDQVGAHVTVLSMGPMQAEAILREAYAMGVDRCILLSDRKFAGADTLATSSALAGALRVIEHDIVFCGRQAIDGDTAQVGPQTAEHLDHPQVSYVENLEYKEDEKTLRVRKQTEDGYQILEVQMPCVLTCLASAIKPRYMTVAGIVDAYGKEVEIWGADKIDVDATHLGLTGSPTRVLQAFAKQLKPAGTLHEVTAEEAVDLIMAKFKERFII